MRILLFSEVTLSEYNVSSILSPIAASSRIVMFVQTTGSLHYKDG